MDPLRAAHQQLLDGVGEVFDILEAIVARIKAEKLYGGRSVSNQLGCVNLVSLRLRERRDRESRFMCRYIPLPLRSHIQVLHPGQ